MQTGLMEFSGAIVSRDRFCDNTACRLFGDICGVWKRIVFLVLVQPSALGLFVGVSI